MKYASILVIGVIVPFNVYGECTPTPDCATIGYTETSCEGDYLACPFDSTKLKCIPCDSSFRYDCSGENITGGTGSACGGKYVSCECSDTEYTFTNGECFPPRCPVGYIYYSDKSCSAELNNSKNPIGVFVSGDKLVMSAKEISSVWGTYGKNIESLPDVNDANTAKIDYNGKEYASILVEAQKSEGLTSSNSAAIYCNEYVAEGTETGDWYLPSPGELNIYVVKNYNKLASTYVSQLAWTSFSNYFWSSSEINNNLAWNVNPYSFYVNEYKKNSKKLVACFLEITE